MLASTVIQGRIYPLMNISLDDVMKISFFFIHNLRQINNFSSEFYPTKERFKSKFKTILAKDNCLRIPKMSPKLF